MSILAVTSELPWPLDSGGHLRTFNLLRALAERCHVRLVAPVPGGRASVEALAALERVGIAPRPAAIPQRAFWRETLRAVGAAVRSEPYVLYRRHHHRAVWRTLVRELADPPDVLYLDHLDSLPFHRVSPQTPRVIDLHNVYSRLVERHARDDQRRAARFYLGREAKLLRRVERDAARCATLLMATSEEDGRHFIDLGATRVRVTPNGVDCAAYAHLPVARRSGDPIVVYVGTMSWEPNASAARFLATDVMPQLRARIPGIRLRIVGRDPSADVKALSALPGVEVTGGVADIARELAAAHVAAVPLEAGSGTRLKILEAFAAGVPVVSTPVGCEGLDAIHDRHLLVADRRGFHDAILAVLENSCRAERLAAAGRTLARERYDWRVVGDAACAAVTSVCDVN